AAAAPLPPPVTDAVERGAVVAATRDGQPRWRAEWGLERTVVDGRTALRLTEAGRGHYAPFEQEVRWTVEALWIAEGRFAPLRVERVVRDPAGRLLLRETKTFEASAGTVRVEREDAAGGRSAAELAVPPDTLAVEGLATALRALPLDPPRTVETHLLTGEPRLYAVGFEPRGREAVRTPAGLFDCYRIEMVPRLGLLGFLRVVVPRTFFWLTASPPHRWVRYEGLEAGLGTPHIVIELAGSGEPAGG
ncbi:MAG TPA: hypothetical protein VNM66_08235, partial [Thermodesulfobacteriota bacterium]|nr:hypothetical protein [Thermodesulfobacteriota bacterium]